MERHEHVGQNRGPKAVEIVLMIGVLAMIGILTAMVLGAM